jgi:hypothetical protein
LTTVAKNARTECSCQLVTSITATTDAPCFRNIPSTISFFEPTGGGSPDRSVADPKAALSDSLVDSLGDEELAALSRFGFCCLDRRFLAVI